MVPGFISLLLVVAVTERPKRTRILFEKKD